MRIAGSPKNTSPPASSSTSRRRRIALTLARDNYGDAPTRTLRFLHGVGLQFHYAFCSTAQFRHPQMEIALSPRTVDCLTLLAGGMTVQEISDHMKVPERTVRYHLRVAARALGTRTPAQTVYEAIKADLIPLEAINPNRRTH